MSDPTPENPTTPALPRTGGPAYHKPGCKCYPCAARRRKEEALTGGSGSDSTPAPQVLNASLTPKDVLIAQDRTARGRVAEWIAYRTADPTLSQAEIAGKLGITPGTLSHMISRGVKEGWLKFDNPLERLENEMVPLAMDNFKKLLKDEDKVATLEAMKGVVFPLYKESKGVSENQQTVLAIKIEYPKPQEGEIVEAKVVGRGNIVGKPNIFDESIEINKDAL